MKKGWNTDEFIHMWKYFRQPNRASPADLKFIKKKILEQGKNVEVLIYGSTPEYRNLCGEIGVKVTCIDFKKYNFEYLKKEIKHLPKEELIESDWMSTVLDKKFNIILADNVINILKKQNLEGFFSNVSKMLEENGLFMPRTFIRDGVERYTTEKTIKEHREKTPKEHFISGIFRNMCMSVYDFENDTMNLLDMNTKIMNAYKEGLISDEEAKYFETGCWNVPFIAYFPDRLYLEKKFSEFFVLEDTFYSKEAFLKDKVPLHILKLKR